MVPTPTKPFRPRALAAALRENNDVMPRRIAKPLAVGLLLLTLAGAEAQTRGTAHFLNSLVDFESLARTDFTVTGMLSTWDRSGANDDGFRPEWVRPDGVYVIADLVGPGVVTRMWTARPGGICRFFVDFSKEPVIDMPCRQFFAGGTSPFVRPLVGPMGGGNYSFFPIPFANSLRIEIAPNDDVPGGPYGAYHHVNYRKFPAGTPLASFQLPLGPEEQDALERVLGIWRHPDRLRASTGHQEVSRQATLAPGEARAVIDLGGTGRINALYFSLDAKSPAALRSTVLRIYWDDGESPSVEVPVGDFFGNGYRKRPFRSLLMGLSEAGEYYAFFPMPFERRALIEVANQSPTETVSVRARVLYGWTPVGRDVGRFHAKWRRQEMVGVDLDGRNRSADHNYPILEVTGRGRYIGATLNVWNRQLRWWGEGDPMIFVDRESWPPRYHGTGTEEYFNDAWGFHEFIESVGADSARRERNVIPVSGVLEPGLSSPGRLFGPNAIFTFHVGDSIPFRRSIRVSVEHGAENGLTNDYSSVAYWYALPGSTDFFRMRPEAERRVQALPGSWEASRLARLRQYAPELRRLILETASAVERFPTDRRRHPERIRILRMVFQIYEWLGVPGTERDRLYERLQEARKGPLEARWPVMDGIYRELGGMLRD